MSKASRDSVNDFYKKLFVEQPSRKWTVITNNQKIVQATQSDKPAPSFLQEIAFICYYAMDEIAFNFFNRNNMKNEKEGVDAGKAAAKSAKKVLIALSIIPILPALTVATMALALAIALISGIIYPFALLGAALKSDKKTDTSNKVIFKLDGGL